MIVVKSDGEKWNIEVCDRYSVDAKSWQRRVILWRPKQNWVSYLLVLFFFLALLFTLSVSRPLIMTISLVSFCCKALSSNSRDAKVDGDSANRLSTIVEFLQIICEIQFSMFKIMLLFIQIKIDSMVQTFVEILPCFEVRSQETILQKACRFVTYHKTNENDRINLGRAGH